MGGIELSRIRDILVHGRNRDILVHGRNRAEHDQRLALVLKRQA